MSDRRKGLLGISPLIVFLVFYLGASLISGDFSKVPLSVAFLVSIIYAVAITSGLGLKDRIRIFGKGAGKMNVILIILIFVCAGAFASSASAMGCIDATANVIMSLLPARYLYVSIFLAGCLISMATGSGVGSIIALGPVATEICLKSGGNMAMVLAIVVCGASFGDNLSFISDTTVIATSTQGCRLKDKFKVNIWMALPASLLTAALLLYLGRNLSAMPEIGNIEYVKIIPYVFIIIFSIVGVDVLVLLLCGTLLCGVMGILMGSFNLFGWFAAIDSGISGVSSLSIIVLFAAGLMELITYNGGIDFLVSICTRFVSGRKSAEVCIACLTGAITACTSNNTIAIISVSSIVRELSVKFGVDPRRAASLMDTSSCIVLELLPYSLHLLVAASFAGIATASMIPYMFYTYLLLFFLILSIAFSRKAVPAVAMLLCFLLPVSCSRGAESSSKSEVPQMMYTVPSDAVGVMNFEKGVSSMGDVLDSSSVFLTLDYGALAKAPMTVSFNYTGSLQQLLAVDCGKTVPDSLESALGLKASADSAGLKCRFVSLKEGECNAVLISRSDNVLDAATLHISQGTSILDAGGVEQALEAAAGGESDLLFPNREASKLPLDRKYVPFLKGFSEWTVISENRGGDFDVRCVHDSDKTYYATLLDAQKNSDSRLADLFLPEFDNIVSLQINSISDYLGAYREYLDAHTLLRRFEENCKEAEAWALNAKVREVAVMSGPDCGYLALRCGGYSELSGIQPNPIQGYPSQLFGKAFGLEDESFCMKAGEWLLIGSRPDLEKYSQCGENACSLSLLWPDDGVKAVVYVTEPWPVLMAVDGNTTIKLKKCK